VKAMLKPCARRSTSRPSETRVGNKFFRAAQALTLLGEAGAK
jgi:hypothetical protein